jgi:hypothetical protein
MAARCSMGREMDKPPPDDGANGENGENGGNGGKKLEYTFTCAIEVLAIAVKKLEKQNIKTAAAVKIRDEVCNDIYDSLEVLQTMKDVFADQAETALFALTPRLSAIEKEIREIKANTVEIKDSAKEASLKKTWAQIANHSNHSSTKKQLSIDAHKEHIRKQHEPYEVNLVTLNDNTKKSIANMPGSIISQHCQELINTETETKPKINGISKTTNGIRLTCETPEDAQMVRSLNWKNAKLDGLQLHKRNYGIVIHRVSTSLITELENEATLKEWSEANRINITKAKPLRRKPRTDRTPAHQSIVVLTHDRHAADRCIKLGFFIDSEYHDTEMYAPQLHVRQCYNCYGYGHLAAQCKHPRATCGKCSAHHKTEKCESAEHTCSNCKGNHPAWAPQCPARKVEVERLGGLRVESPLYFSPE